MSSSFSNFLSNAASGSRASTSDLLKTVDDQKKQLSAYEKKLKDVIRAYKSLLAEKQALENSLQALASTEAQQESSVCSQDEDANRGAQSQNREYESSIASTNDDVASIGSSSQQPTGSNETRLTAVSTLKKALGTITDEKSRQESAFLADKKNLLEQQALKSQYKAMRKEFRATKNLLEQQLNEAKTALRQSQTERECEQNDQSAMLKELQMKLQQEREKTEKIREKMSSLERDASHERDRPFREESQLSQLNQEIDRLHRELKLANQRADAAPALHSLKAEVEQLKTGHLRAMSEEHSRVLASERESVERARQEQTRVGQLELQLQQMSHTVGQFERQRLQDTNTIEKLKQRIAQLEQENQILSATTDNNPLSSTDNAVRNRRQSCVEQEQELLGLCELVKSGQLILSGPPQQLYTALGLPTDLHAACTTRYEQLREEFDKYKLRMQMTKTKEEDTVEGGEKDVGHLQSVIASLRSKLLSVEQKRVDTDKQHQHIVKGLSTELASLSSECEQRVSKERQRAQQRAHEADQEMQKQRQRALDLVDEKEKEVEAMRIVLTALRAQKDAPIDPVDPIPREVRAGSSSRERSVSASSMARGASPSLNSPNDVAGGAGVWLLSGGKGDISGAQVYYQRELTRRGKEVSELRREVTEMKSALRDVQHHSVTKELRHVEMEEKLKEELRSVEGKLTLYRENANIEYLRNVLVQYILCDSAAGKRHMLKAIGSVLKLSNKEMQRIQCYNDKWFGFWATTTAATVPMKGPKG